MLINLELRKEGGTGDDIWFDANTGGYRTPNSMYVMEIAG